MTHRSMMRFKSTMDALEVGEAGQAAVAAGRW
jgi:hypothetical protein